MKAFRQPLICCRTGCLAALAALAPLNAQAPTFPLEIIIIDEQGQPLSGVEGIASGNEFRQERSGGMEGHLQFDLPAGQYDLSFSCTDFYETVIRDVTIEVVEDPKLRNEGVGPIKVLMQRRLFFEKDLIVIGPKYVDAPPLQVEFEPASPLAQGRAVRGTVTLINRGALPIEVPINSQFEYTPETCIMRIFIEFFDRDAYYDEPFVCIPSQDCRILPPGGSIEIPVQAYTRTGYSVGERRPVLWEEGEVSGRIGIYFVLPGLSPHELYTSHAVPTYTRTIEKLFTVTVPSEPD